MNSDSLESVTVRFLSEFGRFLLKLQTFRGADAAALERIQADAAEMARLLKGTPLLPKAMLNEWLMGIKMLRAEAPYVRGKTDRITKFADQLEPLFGLVLLDECLEDLTPGVPRIFWFPDC